MKILLLSNNQFDTFGGYEKVLFGILSLLKKEGHKITILSAAHYKTLLTKEIIPEFKNFEIYRFSSYKNKYHYIVSILFKKIKNKYFLINRASIEEQIRKLNLSPDIILVTDPLLILSSRVVIQNLNITPKIVYWDHGSLNGYLRIGKSNFIYKKEIIKSIETADAFFAISNGIKNLILSFKPNAKVYTVFNPLEKYFGKLIEKSTKAVFLYVGRIEDNSKNLTFMFNGLSKINKDWKLVIVGDGPDKAKLKNLAKHLKIDHKIDWRGFKKDPYENLDKVTALLLTSRWEGFGMVLAEANQRGIPVISSNCKSGPEDIVIPGLNGYLYKEGNMQDFINTIENVISGKLKFGTPKEIAETAKRFDIDSVAYNIKNALREISQK